jgi:2-polyprenyl-6-methoxyphenol hydroxylase-like FAD-dependent oxidoreductase
VKEILEVGHRLERVAFYEGPNRRAEVLLSKLPAEFPYVVLVPQTELEEMLEHQLQARGRVKVQWNQRFSDVTTQGATVVAAIDKMVQTAKGYIVPEWEWVVEKTVQTHAAYLIGADGPNSHVRQCLGIPVERMSGPEFFAVYEFATDGKYAEEMGVVLDKATSSVFWPLSNQKCRWSFQLLETQVTSRFPEKETRALRVQEPVVDEETTKHLHTFLQERAPWFKGAVQDVEWSIEVQFAHQLARRFSEGRCWLIGDAAHQTSPVGVQSMNVGMCEAERLASTLVKVLRENAPVTLLENYQKNQRQDWEQLLGAKGGLKATPAAEAWVKTHCAQILPCLPASGEDLRNVLTQLGLELS